MQMSKGEETKHMYGLCYQSSTPSPNPVLFFSHVFSVIHFCPPNPVVAGELQENIWGQRQQPTTQYSCTGMNEHFILTFEVWKSYLQF